MSFLPNQTNLSQSEVVSGIGKMYEGLVIYSGYFFDYIFVCCLLIVYYCIDQLLLCAAAGIYICDEADAASTSRRAVILCFTHSSFMIIPQLILILHRKG